MQAIDDVKNRVAVHDKLDARMMTLKEDLEEISDDTKKSFGDIRSEFKFFTTQVERRQADSDALTRRVINTSESNIDRVRRLVTMIFIQYVEMPCIHRCYKIRI